MPAVPDGHSVVEIRARVLLLSHLHNGANLLDVRHQRELKIIAP
jgi:hypothetical protein